ncbi:hypothetical protein SCRM01_280 [Synechococcus phage S-CRM01]|uniref:hypothetical protein n=1 Tax=Synechococcus phage S-CRM01 TaxID=1026955 RepID=UPI000209E314|nr:hypothetical protein SCRM01_280 [Synechococcus phage S-CRM01]AEC53226.1 hypothetical protein SCRM01_280 [Synechococcus phage S-CRM01]
MTELERAKEFLMLHWAEDYAGGRAYLLGDPERLGKFLRAVVKKFQYIDDYGDSFVVVDELLELADALEKLEE